MSEKILTGAEEEFFSSTPEIVTFDSIDAALSPLGISYQNAEHVHARNYSKLLNKLGLLPTTVETRIASAEKKGFLFVKSVFREGVDVLQITEARTDQNIDDSNDQVEILDLLFISKDTGKTFSLKNLHTGNIVVDNSLVAAWSNTLDEQIELVPPGEILYKQNLLLKFIRHYYKRIEPLIIFHEVAHCKQNVFQVMKRAHGTQPDRLQLNRNQNNVHLERDAWRYAIECIRELRRQGITLLPDLGNTEIINYINLALISYDSSYPYPLYRNFSRLLGTRSTLPPLVYSVLFYPAVHQLKLAKAMIRTIVAQPSLVTEGIRALKKR